MTEQQLDSWRKVRAAGLVALILGWFGVVISSLFIVFSFVLIIANFQIPGDPGTAPMPSWVLGVIFLVVFLVFALPFAILDVIAGTKLRKPVAKPKGWLIYMVVIGALGITSITGILFLIFSIIALSGLHEIEGTEPPKVIV